MFTRKRCYLYVTHHLKIPQLLPWSEISSSKKWSEILFFASWKWVYRPIYAVFSKQKIGLWITFSKIWFHFMVAIVVFLDDVWHTNNTFCVWTYFLNRPICFGWLRHVFRYVNINRHFWKRRRPQIKKIKKRKALRIKKYKEIRVSGLNLEKKCSVTVP